MFDVKQNILRSGAWKKMNMSLNPQHPLPTKVIMFDLLKTHSQPDTNVQPMRKSNWHKNGNTFPSDTWSPEKCPFDKQIVMHSVDHLQQTLHQANFATVMLH